MSRQHSLLINITAALFIFVVAIPLASAAVIYTWVDDKGVVHYSEQPPKGVNATKIYSEDIEPAKAGYIAPKKREQVQKQSELEKSAAIINATDKEQAKELCESAKHSLSVLKSYNRLTRKNEKTGEMEQMTAEQKTQAINENEQRVKLFCK
ncbi:DUF4124 domain-containing protein [Shewanella maritima]|uniref:DUF4124 domain-containing protein n=1 Tax=Shewanella maritima TaxID=2520507 RepID=A0A411PJH3_9GAMM|nr:DUF4124 domain-containing protein [Shewanella maritima]QBF83685.1 DUF4124 domain-containing protein [Shewanella maritima]